MGAILRKIRRKLFPTTHLTFIGEDGSMGLKRGKVYGVRIFTDELFFSGKICIWVEWHYELDPFATQSCPYSSVAALARNWRLPRDGDYL